MKKSECLVWFASRFSSFRSTLEAAADLKLLPSQIESNNYTWLLTVGCSC